MIARFGIWEIIENDGLIGRVHGGDRDYRISRETLWQTTTYNGILIWDWLFHVSHRDWINSDNYNDFVVAFLFAQDYFNDLRPENVQITSSVQSILICQELANENNA